MRIDIITLFPDFFKNSFSYSIFQRAIKNKIIEIKIHDLRKFTKTSKKVSMTINMEVVLVWSYVLNQSTIVLKN